MGTNYEFGRGLINVAEQKELVVSDLERMVQFAAEPVKPGQTVKEQIRNASEALQIDFGTIRRCWYGLASTGVYPTVYNAWASLIERRSRELEARGIDDGQHLLHRMSGQPQRERADQNRVVCKPVTEVRIIRQTKPVPIEAALPSRGDGGRREKVAQDVRRVANARRVV